MSRQKFRYAVDHHDARHQLGMRARQQVEDETAVGARNENERTRKVGGVDQRDDEARRRAAPLTFQMWLPTVADGE
jgi:hypothetical protein